jgi:hypothetical protein
MAQSAPLGKSESRCHMEDMTGTPKCPSVPPPRPADGSSTEAAPQPGEAGPRETGPREIGPREIGGPKGPEPTRYGDWEVNGRCSDF